MNGRAGTPARGRLVLPLTITGLVVIVLGWLASGIELGDAGHVRSDTPAVSVERDDGRTWRIVRFLPDARVDVETTIAHRGVLPVDVVGIEQTRRRAPADHCGWWPTRTLIDGREPQPQAPVRLTRGTQAALVVIGTLEGEDGCLSAEGAMWQDRVRVETHVVGVPRTVTVRLPTVVVWATEPQATAARFGASPVAPRVGTAP